MSAGLKNKFFMGWLRSFELGNPIVRDSWKDRAASEENNDFDVVVFKLPKDRASDFIFSIEKMLQDRTK